jgi:hypothetical protein
MKSPPVNPPSKLAVLESTSPEQVGTQSISRSESGSASATTVTDPGNSLPPQSVQENAAAASPTSEVKP